jgi:DNA polymerase elongation subunit (family B)
MVKIDEVMNISENSLALQRLLICPFDCTFYNSQMGAAYFMRNADWIAPTGIKGDKQKYEAAFVMNPDEEQTFGIHENVAVLDFKSLYPSMMASRNISWETKDYISPVGEFTEEYHKVAFDVPKNLQDWEKQNIDVCYSKDELGVLPKAVLSLMHMRDEYKTNRKNAKNDEEYRKWDSAQMATKRVVNAFYGVLAKDGYGWGDVDMAQSITASAREAMRSVAFKAIEYGYDVIYGHTDSIFVKVKGVGDAKQLCLRLNDYIRNEVFNECVELEFEKLAETFFLSKKKNRYCGFLSWKDGEYLKEKDFFVMGFETKKSNETKFAKDFQENILKMVADKKEEKEVTKYAKELYKKIIDGEIPFEDVVKRMRMRRELDEYKSISGGMSGVYYNNKYNVGQPINVGDSFYYYTVDNNKIKEYPRQFEVNGILRNVEYIASKDIQDLDNNFPVAWKRLAESEVIKKVNLIYESMGWNLNSISDSGEQKTLDEWW